MSKQQKVIFLTLGFLLLLDYSELSHTVITVTSSGGMLVGSGYRVVIYGDGTVIYEGSGAYMGSQGIQVGKIERSKVDELMGEFAKANFFLLEDEYAAFATDIPTITISLRMGARNKTIVDHGDAPWALRILEYKIGEIANPQQWVGEFPYRRSLIQTPLATPPPSPLPPVATDH